jgi:rhodanese-related sulfurtransferase
VKWLKYSIFLLIIVVGCSKSSAIQNISVQEAQDMILKDEITILDVRTPEEYDSGHIPNSELIPLHELEGRTEDLDKNATYLIVCRSGNRSQQASDLLSKKGFEKIYNMVGGMNEWTGEVEK